MPRTTRTQPSQKPSTSRRKQNQSLTQKTLEQSFSRSQSQRALENIDELVNNCVRFIVYRAGSNLPVRKSDIQKHVLKNVGRSFDQILSKVTTVLKNVYGYDLYLCDDGNTYKQYLVSNTLPCKTATENVQIQIEDEEDIPAGVHKILIMLVVTHLFMSNNNVSEASIFAFLRSIQIDPDEKHAIFGNVKDFITSTMVKQKYLRAEVDQLTRRVSYLWGPRAENEISKHELLKFVCKIYKDRTPRSWTSQFESAEAQFAEEEIVENGIETGEEELSD